MLRFKKRETKEKSGFYFCVFKVDENKTILHKPSSVQEGRNGEFNCNIPFG